MNKEKQRISPPRSLFSIIWIFVTLSLLTANCVPQPVLARGTALTLTTFSESSVEVVIMLQRAANGQVSLTATYTPLEAGYHLYSKNLPRNGISGVGRPTLLELNPDSRMQATGLLQESIESEMLNAYPNNLPVYPDGSVTLTLPVHLPDGYDWVTEEISLTYMACSASLCKAPVTGKIISIKVPGAEALTN